MTTIVRYFVPEDKDTEDKPNAFIINKPQDQLRLKDLRESFPLPGEYHFRFKFPLTNKKVVWLDFNKEETAIPLFNNKIIIKVSRLSWQSSKVINHSVEDFPDLN
jgi:hypothetical protein